MSLSKETQIMLFIDAAILVALCFDVWINHQILEIMRTNGGSHV